MRTLPALLGFTTRSLFLLLVLVVSLFAVTAAAAVAVTTAATVTAAATALPTVVVVLPAAFARVPILFVLRLLAPAFLRNNDLGLATTELDVLQLLTSILGIFFRFKLNKAKPARLAGVEVCI